MINPSNARPPMVTGVLKNHTQTELDYVLGAANRRTMKDGTQEWWFTFQSHQCGVMHCAHYSAEGIWATWGPQAIMDFIFGSDYAFLIQAV